MHLPRGSWGTPLPAVGPVPGAAVAEGSRAVAAPPLACDEYIPGGWGWGGGQRAGKEEKAAAAKELEEEEGISAGRMRRTAGKSDREDGDGMNPNEGRE